MKPNKLQLLLPVVALLLAVMPAQANESEAEVRAVIDALQSDWNGGDMSAYLAAYAQQDETRMLSSAGIYAGWETINELFRQQFPDEPRMGDFTIDDVAVRLLADDVAVVSGLFEHVFTEMTVRGAFSQVLRRQEDGRWLIEHEHTSRSEVIQTGDGKDTD